MRHEILYVIILATELQLVFCQGDSSSLPVTYSTTALEGEEQVCPPHEQQEMARAEIVQELILYIAQVAICIMEYSICRDGTGQNGHRM